MKERALTVLVSLLVFFPGVPVLADDFCETLSTLVDEASKGAEAAFVGEDAQVPPLPGFNPSSCKVLQSDDGDHFYFCAADAHLSELPKVVDAVTACDSVTAKRRNDTEANFAAPTGARVRVTWLANPHGRIMIFVNPK